MASHGVLQAYPPNHPYPDNCSVHVTQRGELLAAPLLAAAIVGQNPLSTSMVRTNDGPANTAGVGESRAKGASRPLPFGSELGDAGGFSGQAALYSRRS